MQHHHPNDQDGFRSNGLPWHFRVLCTPIRSHIASVIVVAMLTGTLTWIWTHPNSLAADHSHEPGEIEDAISLISSRDRLENHFNEASQEQSGYHKRIGEIAKWLPRERSWESVRRSLQATAASSDVRLVALDQGNTHLGSRVAVIHVTCEIQGSYPDVCVFLSKLTTLVHPIWCDEARIVRDTESKPGNDTRVDSSKGMPCLASLSLRVPFAGEASTAAKLLQRSPGNDI